MTEQISWKPVHSFVRRLLAGRGTTIIAGTPEWSALLDDDPRKLAAILTAGSRWCLEIELGQIHARAAAEKDAAVDISTALPWAQVARRIADRDAFYRAHPDLKRKKAS